MLDWIRQYTQRPWYVVALALATVLDLLLVALKIVLVGHDRGGGIILAGVFAAPAIWFYRRDHHAQVSTLALAGAVGLALLVVGGATVWFTRSEQATTRTLAAVHEANLTAPSPLSTSTAATATPVSTSVLPTAVFTPDRSAGYRQLIFELIPQDVKAIDQTTNKLEALAHCGGIAPSEYAGCVQQWKVEVTTSVEQHCATLLNSRPTDAAWKDSSFWAEQACQSFLKAAPAIRNGTGGGKDYDYAAAFLVNAITSAPKP